MHELLAAAEDQGRAGFDWGVLLVPLVGALVAIAVAMYNTRGETAALRRLKAMNDVIAQLPEESDVRLNFTAARDVLAQRVSLRLTGRRRRWFRVSKRWTKIPAWGYGVAGGISAAAGLIVIAVIVPPATSGLPLVLNFLVTSVVAGILVWSWASRIRDRAEARRRVDAARPRKPSHRA